MRLVSARTYSRLYAVLLALSLALAALQPAFAHNLSVPQPKAMQTNMHSLHEKNTQILMHCAVDCAGTVHHCCLYALCASLPLIPANPSAAHHSLLPYFFSSRQVTPLTKPPKTT